ncbi:MAG: hypothetical protein EPN88_12360 [Bacteroidetes bacterium]|nr:MAG: hypothetical protein EPN88_12360 [Bacteroidota bacterium]
MKTKFFLMIAALAMLSFSSCKKDSGSIEQATVDMADDDAVADNVFEDVFSTADNATIILDAMGKSIEAKSETTVTDSCPVISITHPTGSVWPILITVDFGISCTGIYDNTRSGKILIEVTGPRMHVGSKATITFVDYYFNGIKVEGTKVLENMGYNSNQNLVISVKLTNGKLTLPDGKVIERSVDHQREWIAGLLTKNIWDDECLITGTATGKNINGIAYTNTIMTALHWTRACRFIVSGVVKIERAEVLPVEIDYGTGDCDAKAVVTRNGESKEILLKNKHRNM